jgi:hypothetical protein
MARDAQNALADLSTGALETVGTGDATDQDVVVDRPLAADDVIHDARQGGLVGGAVEGRRVGRQSRPGGVGEAGQSSLFGEAKNDSDPFFGGP